MLTTANAQRSSLSRLLPSPILIAVSARRHQVCLVVRPSRRHADDVVEDLCQSAGAPNAAVAVASEDAFS